MPRPGIPEWLRFVGRRRELHTAIAAMDGSAANVILNIWGVAGIGKTALSNELLRIAAKHNRRPALLDLEALILDRTAGTLAPEFLGYGLASAIVHCLPLEQRQRRQWLRRLERTLHEASDRFIDSHPPVVVHQTATHSGQISNVHIDIAVSEASLHRYRRDVASALHGLFDELDLRDVVLVIDTSEALYWLDDRATKTPREGFNAGIAHWFCHDVIGRLVNETGPTVAVVGREPLRHEFGTLEVAGIELTEWSPEETEEFVASVGLPRALADSLFAACLGVPLWTALVAEVCLRSQTDGGLPTSDWVDRMARSRPAEQWLPQVFLRRLSETARSVMWAAATLRSVTREAVEHLLRGEVDLSSEYWWTDLCRYSFIQSQRIGDAPMGQRRVHPLVRAATLTTLSRDQPERLRQLNVRAAEYFAGQGMAAEEHYHRFAAGDDSRFGAWDGSIEELVQHFDFEEATRLIDSALSSDYLDQLKRTGPGIRGHGLLWRARIARRRDQIDEALLAYGEALSCFQRMGAVPHQLEVLDELGRLEWRCGDRQIADRRLSEALALAGASGDREWSARLLECRAARSVSDADARHALEEAERIYVDLEDHHGHARVLQALGDRFAALPDSVDYYRRAAQVSEISGCDILHAEVLTAAGLLDAGRGEILTSLGQLEEASEIYQRNELPERRARVLRNMAWVRLKQGQFQPAKALLLEAVAAYQVAQDPASEAETMRELATAIADWEGHRTALDFLEAALNRSRRIDDVDGMAATMEVLADLRARLQAWPQERGTYDHAIAGYRQARNWTGLVRVLRTVASHASTAGDHVSARTYLNSGYELAAEYRPEELAGFAVLLGENARDLGRLQRARDHFSEGSVRSGVRGAEATLGFALKGLAEVAFLEGQYAEAIRFGEEAAKTLRSARRRVGLGYTLQGLGDAYVALGNAEMGKRYYNESVAVFDDANPDWAHE